MPASPPAWLSVGLALLFLTASVYGALEVHYSGDTWIALAAGRQVEGWAGSPRREIHVNQADVVILGAGSGGYACAFRAAELGLRVARVLAARGQVDASEASALADRNEELSSELGETRKVLERLMSEYSAAFDRETAERPG